MGPFLRHLFRYLCSEQHCKMYAFTIKMMIVLASFNVANCIAWITVASVIVINMPTNELLAGETKNCFL